jgi:hypothetical protein
MLRVQCDNHAEMELPPGRQSHRRAEMELLARRRLRRRAEIELPTTRCRSWDGAAGSGTSPSWQAPDPKVHFYLSLVVGQTPEPETSLYV